MKEAEKSKNYKRELQCCMLCTHADIVKKQESMISLHLLKIV